MVSHGLLYFVLLFVMAMHVILVNFRSVFAVWVLALFAVVTFRSVRIDSYLHNMSTRLVKARPHEVVSL